MSASVKDWKQAGHIYAWRYGSRGRHRAGWHVTADDAACDAIVALLDRMAIEARAQYRTIRLDRVSPEIWRVPNFGPPDRDRFVAMRIRYEPGYPDLVLAPEDERLVLRVGPARLAELRSGFVEVRIGGGDFALAPNDRRGGEPLWFWWMLRGGGASIAKI